MAYSAYQNSDNLVPYYVDLVADEVADIDTLPTDFAPGSTCLVIENSSVYVLGVNGVWKEI